MEAVVSRMLPPGLRSDLEGSSSREDRITVFAQMLSSGRFRLVRLQRPFPKLDPVKSVRPERNGVSAASRATFRRRLLRRIAEHSPGR
jgi:hypothetical protein